MKITIVYNIPSDEKAKDKHHLISEEDTELSAKMVQAALAKKHIQASLFPISEHTVHTLYSISADAIINLIEWTGQDFFLHGKKAFDALERLGIPYTGSPYSAFFLSTDKAVMKKEFDRLKLSHARWQLFTQGDEVPREDFIYPVIVKLAHEHCGLGLTSDAVVHRKEDLLPRVQSRIAEFAQPIIVEEFIEGRELQVTLLEENREISVLPIAEYAFSPKSPEKFLTYDGRWDNDAKNHAIYTVVVASLPPHVEKYITSECRRAYRELGFADYARFDIRLRGETPYLLEINANPGIDEDPENGLVTSFVARGMDLGDFMKAILLSCFRRYRVQRFNDALGLSL